MCNASRGRFVGFVGVMTLTVFAGVITSILAQSPPATTTAPSTRPAISADARNPISYFNANCSSCHGNYGSFWGEGFAGDRGDELRKVVEEMGAGPGFAPIEGVALDVQTAYNRALSAGKDAAPFVVACLDDGRLVGEVTPESKVILQTEAGEVEATVDGHTWSSDVAAEKVQAIQVTRGGKSTGVEWHADTRIAWSHRDQK